MAISRTSIATDIEQFIRTAFQVAADDPLLTHDVHLFDAGFVDSVGLAELLAFLEATFGVAIDNEDLFSEEFTTITGISNVIASRLPGAEPADAEAAPALRSA
jgi:methoxymalonate biosynthesis acyl carrier protein